MTARLWALAALIAILPSFGVAQPISDEDAALIATQEAAAEDGEAAPVEEGLGDDAVERLPPPKLTLIDYANDTGVEALEAAIEEYFRYHETGYQHRRQVFAWQLLSSQIIFGIVMVIVGLGLYFSWKEFNRDYRSGASKSVHSVEATPKGIKVSSPVLGVIILALSLGFFYLYLVYVYPVEELF